jgi:hypothetical protein
MTEYKRHRDVALEHLPNLVRELLQQEYRHLYIVISIDAEKAKVEAWKR